jgi:diguanylate cyclase (GGDEF)-like protein
LTKNGKLVIDRQPSLPKERTAMELDLVLSKLSADEKRFVSTLIDKDPLTGAYNRRKFDQDIALLEAMYKRTNKGSSLLIIDIDHFKKYNDKHGHLAGDRVLKQVTRTIEKSLRYYDKIHLYRYGGEEFVLIIPDITAEEAFGIGERLRMKVETSCPVTVSVGISQRRTISEGMDRLFKEADAALYEAKRKGRNRVVAYDKASFEPEGGKDRGQRSEVRGQRLTRRTRDQRSEVSDSQEEPEVRDQRSATHKKRVWILDH